MIKEQFLVLNLVCFITATIYAESIGLVKEFEVENSNNRSDKKNITEHRNESLTYPGMLKANKQSRTTNETEQNEAKKENDTQLHDTSMYTDSDLEETSSHDNNELDGPDTNEKGANNTSKRDRRKEENKQEEMSSVYTESDLEATASKHDRKHGENQEREKRSAGSYIFVPHKRDLTDVEQDEGSGEGSGQEPLANNTN